MLFVFEHMKFGNQYEYNLCNSENYQEKKIPQKIRTKVFDQYVWPPVMTYGAQTGTLIQQAVSKLRITQSG